MSLVQTPRSERIQGSFPYVTLEYSNNIPSPSPGVRLFDKWNGKKKNINMISKCLIEKTFFTHLTAEAW